MKKIGLYGGTFNPIHFGHLNLAFELMEKGGLDEVWWIPTNRSPLRSAPLVEATLRLKMVELAINEIPQFKVLKNEITKPPPSYTIDTVTEIVQAYSDHQFFLLLGEDSLKHLMAWKEPLRLVQQIPLLIGGRGGEDTLPSFPHEIHAAIENGLLKTSLFDISATTIRERLKNKLFTGHLIPAKVLDFICVNQLYFTV